MTRRKRFVGFGVAALVLLFLVVKLLSPSSGGTVANGFSDAPFGPFAGYAWIGKVQSVGASFTVPRIASGSPLSEAGTWIGMQGAGPPARFVQIGALEGRFWSRQEEKTVDLYTTFWSDTARHFKPQPLFPVSAGDTLSLKRLEEAVAPCGTLVGRGRSAVSFAPRAKRSRRCSNERDRRRF